MSHLIAAMIMVASCTQPYHCTGGGGGYMYWVGFSLSFHIVYYSACTSPKLVVLEIIHFIVYIYTGIRIICNLLSVCS